MTVTTHVDLYPCLSNPTLRPHICDEVHRERIQGWLEERGGIVVYIDYDEGDLSFEPMFKQARRSDTPGDNFVWKNSREIMRDERGYRLMVAPSVISHMTGNVRYRKVAIDLIIPDMELRSIDDVLDSAFDWTTEQDD